jgi:transcriptional regulator with XRE-family HTH domain
MSIEIGENIQTIRERKGISQRDMENRIRMSRCRLSRIENNYLVPQLRALMQIADGLGVGISEIFMDTTTGDKGARLTRDETAFLTQLREYSLTISGQEWPDALKTMKRAMTNKRT